MRLACSTAAVLLLSAGVSIGRAPEPFVPVGLWYPPDRTTWRRDLPIIRAAGFNTVWTPIDWAQAEPTRGTYKLDALDRLLTAADESRLAVVVQIDGTSPPWLAPRYPDAAPVSDRGRASRGYCLDHPGVRSDITAFIGAVTARAADHASFHAVDVWRDPRLVSGTEEVPPGNYCYCPHTRRAFREWLERKYVTVGALNAAWRRSFRSWDAPEPPGRGGSAGPDRIDWASFTAARLHDQLEMKVAASAARGARPVTAHSSAPSVMLRVPSGAGDPDDWWMASAVGSYGTSAHLPFSSDAQLSPVMLTFAFDGQRSAGRDRGWWLSELHAAPRRGSSTPVSSADLRLSAWTALSRGARAIGLRGSPDRRATETDTLIGEDGALTPEARAIGQLADLVSSNAALFAPLRPRASRVAIAYDPLAYVADAGAGGTAGRAHTAMVEFYWATFARNLQTDFLHPDEIATGLATGYRAVFLGHAPTLPRTVLEALKLYVRSGGALVGSVREFDALGIEPDVRIDPPGTLVEARFLESADVLLLIATNHADVPQKVTLTFPPDVPEAVWQNMESGANVNFVAGPAGPTYTRSFAPRDVLVLMIRKRLK
jgi:hypothetical protein